MFAWHTRTHLFLRHRNRLFQHDPGDALVQRGRGQRSQVGPVVEAAGQEALGVEALEVCDASLRHDRRDNMARVTGEQVSKGRPDLEGTTAGMSALALNLTM